MSTTKKKSSSMSIRPPRSVDDFVSGSSPPPVTAVVAMPAPAPLSTAKVKASAAPTAQAPVVPGAGRRRGVVARADGTEARRITVYLRPDVAQKLRRRCFEYELDMTEEAAVAIEKYLDSQA